MWRRRALVLGANVDILQHVHVRGCEKGVPRDWDGLALVLA